MSQDVGSPVVAGKATGSRGNFTITAAGADVWGTADQFHFLYLRVSGDVDVTARVVSVGAADAWSKAGVMIRASLDASSAHAFMLASAGKGMAFQRRTAAGALSKHTAGLAVAPPQWVRLVRAGSRVTAYSSTDGSSWTTVGSDTISLGSSAYVGVAVTAHNDFRTTTAVVSNLTVLPSGQAARDVGAPSLVGNANFSGIYTIAAAGRDIWDTADQFQFVYQLAAGDIDVSARVTSIGFADQWSKAGVMIRESLNAGSRHAFVLASAGRGYAFQRRATTNGVSDHTAGPASPPPGWVRLTRVGSVFTAYVSTDGQTWQKIGSDTISMASTVYVGIAATSHNTTAYSTIKADSFRVTSPSSSTPTSTTAPQGVAFQEASDQLALISSYRFDVFAATANPSTSSPVASINVGKPAADATGSITVSVPTFFSALAAGNYQLTVAALGPGGVGRSAPVAFTR